MTPTPSCPNCGLQHTYNLPEWQRQHFCGDCHCIWDESRRAQPADAVLVPIDPTKEMLKVVKSNWSGFADADARPAAKRLYKAMIAAAPSQPTPPIDERTVTLPGGITLKASGYDPEKPPNFMDDSFLGETPPHPPIDEAAEKAALDAAWRRDFAGYEYGDDESENANGWYAMGWLARAKGGKP